MKTKRKIKKPDSSSKLVLEGIIGLTTKNGNGLASNVWSGNCVYVAGCVVVVYNVESGTQSYLMVSHRTPRPLSCVAVSGDGRFVAAVESGNQPAVLIWDIATLTMTCELKGHVYGVSCVAFSPDGKYLTSVGGYICLWDRRSGRLLTKLKASSSSAVVASVSFTSDAKYIVTAGKKHLKFWAVGCSVKTHLGKRVESVTMHGKPVNLGIHKGSSFVSISSLFWTNSSITNREQSTGFYPICALTDAGVLCLVDSELSVKNSLDLKVGKGFSLSSSNKLLACSCSNGVVQLYTTDTLECAGSLLYSKVKNYQEDSESTICHTEGDSTTDYQLAPTLPDAVACQFSTSEKLVVVYGDHTLYIWDIHDVTKATRLCVLGSHSACIWDAKNLFCENTHAPSLACVARGCSGGISFATCSTDGTIRLWDLALHPDSLKDAIDPHSLGSESVASAHLAVNAGIFERDTVDVGVSNQGFRSMAVSPDGKYLAAGDCDGNLHIYNLHTSDYTCLQHAHDAEILTLSFSLPSNKSVVSEEVVDKYYFLASGGRDRIIHLYDANRNFDLIGSIDDHSAAVTSVKLTSNGHKILSCSADRSLVFRDIAITRSGLKISRCHHQMASHGTVYDMAIDSTMDLAITVGQDKKINTFNITSGKLVKSFRQDRDFGDPIKVSIDPSCSYLACSYSNKSICMYDFISGEMVGQAVGHGEVVTGVIFLPDCKHIISVGGDACIFVWRLPTHLSSRMLQTMKENSEPLSPRSLVQPVTFCQVMVTEGEQHFEIKPENIPLMESSNQVAQRVLYQGWSPQKMSAFKFSISRLPRWAQDKVTSPVIIPRNLECSSFQEETKILPPLVVEDRVETPACPEIQTPSKHDMGNSNSSLGNQSRSPNSDYIHSSNHKENHSFTKEQRWLTVYTVCHILNSPELQNLCEKAKRQVSSSSSQDTGQISANGELSFVDCIDVEAFRQSATSKSYREPLGKGVPEQLHSDKIGSIVQTTEHANANRIKCEETDLFKQHFGNLSTSQKIRSKKSSVMRRYSAQYVVRHNYLGDGKKLFDTPARDTCGKTLKGREEAAVNVSLDELTFPVLREQQVVNSCEQELKNSVQSTLSPGCAVPHVESTKLPPLENLKDVSMEARDPKECISKGSQVQESIVACREALLSLDAAAEYAVKLFSKLGAMLPREEVSGEAEGAQLYDGAAALLPSISEKVNTVAKLVSSQVNFTVEVPRYEPMLGTFAESLSQKVMEILQKNLRTD